LRWVTFAISGCGEGACWTILAPWSVIRTIADSKPAAPMTDRIRIIRHEAVPQCGSFEVRFPDGGPSRFFYWDDVPGRRMRPDQVDSEHALEAAKALARGESDR
jgi:hypothetical protein